MLLYKTWHPISLYLIRNVPSVQSLTNWQWKKAKHVIPSNHHFIRNVSSVSESYKMAMKIAKPN